MYRITNTAFNRAKEHLHRVAPKFDPEPDFGGRRLRNGESIEISDEHYERVKDMLAVWEKTGVVDITHFFGAAEPTLLTKEGAEEKRPSVAEKNNEETGAGPSDAQDGVSTSPTAEAETPPAVETAPKRGPGKKRLF